jgi:cell division septal protein FtsQ
MSTKPNLSRSQFVRQRRTSRFNLPLGPKAQAKKPVRPVKRSYRPDTPQPGEAKSARAVHTYRQGTGSLRQAPSGAQQYAFSLGRADVRAPALSIPQLGARWLSGAATLLLLFLLYTLWTSSTFTVIGAEIHGNRRLGITEINAALQLVGQPIFMAVPADIAANLRSDYPDLSSVRVHVGIPNRVVVDVVERAPVLAWTQGDTLRWIDASGVAFPARGSVTGLIPVTAEAAPPQVQTEAATPLYDRPFIAPDVVKALAALYPYLPQDVAMTYDPIYGIGWQDTRGWSVYFGQTTDDILMKLQVYQAIVNTLTQQGIQPMLISVEYLDAPFYK